MSRNAYLLRVYGITEAQYNELLLEQGGCCAVCKRHANEFKTRLAVEHDHVEKFIRGLVCTSCNRFVIGRHRRGNGGAVLLANAAEYLNRPHRGWYVPEKKKRAKRRKKR